MALKNSFGFRILNMQSFENSAFFFDWTKKSEILTKEILIFVCLEIKIFNFGNSERS
jgi:hypothetical protein